MPDNQSSAYTLLCQTICQHVGSVHQYGQVVAALIEARAA